METCHLLPPSFHVLRITIPEALVEEAERRWATPTDPIFDSEFVPPGCEQHISSVYAQLGSPVVDFIRSGPSTTHR